MSDWNNQSGGETECSASLETLEHVLLPRHQLALAVLDVGYGAKAIILQLKDEIRVVKRRGYARRIDGLDPRETHISSISEMQHSEANEHTLSRLCVAH